MATLRFGAFELDQVAGELRKQGRLVALTGQPLRVLDLLASNAGQVVTRAELRRQIWGAPGHETHVDFDASLSTCINQVRSALGDRAAAPRFVETLPKRGYRFVAPVEVIEAAAAIAAPDAQASAAAPRRRWPWALAGGALAVVAVAIVATNWPASPAAAAASPPPSPRFAVPPIPVAVLPVWLDRRVSTLEPLAASLTDALIGALATEGGDRLRVASPVAVRHLREGATTLDGIANVGADYYVTTKLTRYGERINVHTKVSTIGGWMLWSTDRQYRPEELSREQLALAAELSKLYVREIQTARQRVEPARVTK